jgi:hypothetical protein
MIRLQNDLHVDSDAKIKPIDYVKQLGDGNTLAVSVPDSREYEVINFGNARCFDKRPVTLPNSSVYDTHDYTLEHRVGAIRVAGIPARR